MVCLYHAAFNRCKRVKYRQMLKETKKAGTRVPATISKMSLTISVPRSAPAYRWPAPTPQERLAASFRLQFLRPRYIQ